MNLKSSDIIKTFLKVDSPKFGDKPYYAISKNKKSITLFDKVIKAPSDSSTEFEEDKIFTESDENSYIYEEICLNSIKEALNGVSCSFIFHGDSSSSKFNLAIGDIREDKTNYNKYGIFLRYVDNLLKEKNKDIKFEISYFMLNESDIFDLSKLKNKNLDINNFTLQQLNKYKYTIKNEENILNQIEKIDLEKMSKELHFLSKILNLLSKLESSEESKIYSLSHFCITIYIFNQKTQENSLVNFLILNGCEYLYYGLYKKFQITANVGNKKPNEEVIHENIVEGSKVSLETQYTYETLLNLIKLKLFADVNTDNLSENDLNLIMSKKKQNSKLSNILYNMLYNIPKINFRIISTVTPSTGQYQSFRDSLLFLLDFNKLKKKSSKKKSEMSKMADKNLFKNMSKEKTVKLLLEQKEDIEKKDNKIFILENDIIDYKKEIKEAKKEINQRNEKISFLEKAYTEQVNVLKKKLEFDGDINVLIAGDENSEELKHVKKIKNLLDNNKLKENDIKKLEEKLNEKDEEIKQLKNEIEIIKSNETLLNYYLSAKKSENFHKAKKVEYEEKNKLRNTIENLENEIKTKNKLIEKYIQDINTKNKILINLPQSLKDTYTHSLTNTKKLNNSIPTEENEKNKENIDKESLETDNIYENEIKNIKKENKLNINKVKIDCEKIIEQKNEDIKKMQYEYDKLKIERNNDINKYIGEIIGLNKLLMKLVSNYKRIFSSNLTPKINFMNYSTKIDEFNKIITGINQEITYDKYPFLFDYLTKHKQFKINQPFLYNNIKKIYSPIMNDLEEKNNDKNIEIKSHITKKDTKSKNNEDINKFFKEKIEKLIIGIEKLELMSKEDLVKHILNINENLIEMENNLKKYNNKNKKGLNLEDMNITEGKNKDEIISELKNKLIVLNNRFEEQITRNNKNEIIIGAQNRKIDRLQKESYILTHNMNMKNKRQGSSILTPNRSTLYNSSGFDFNSNFSENNTTNKNNLNKTLKKSNSCLTINKPKNKRPLSYKLKKFPENDVNKNFTTNKVLSREFSSKLKEFQIERENNIINSIKEKK